VDQTIRLFHESPAVDFLCVTAIIFLFVILADRYSILGALVATGVFAAGLIALIIWIDGFRQDWASPYIGTFTFEEGELG